MSSTFTGARVTAVNKTNKNLCSDEANILVEKREMTDKEMHNISRGFNHHKCPGGESMNREDWDSWRKELPYSRTHECG